MRPHPETLGVRTPRGHLGAHPGQSRGAVSARPLPLPLLRALGLPWVPSWVLGAEESAPPPCQMEPCLVKLPTRSQAAGWVLKIYLNSHLPPCHTFTHGGAFENDKAVGKCLDPNRATLAPKEATPGATSSGRWSLPSRALPGCTVPGAGRGGRLPEAWHLLPHPGRHRGSGGSSWPGAGGQTPPRGLGSTLVTRGSSVLKNSLKRVP